MPNEGIQTLADRVSAGRSDLRASQGPSTARSQARRTASRRRGCQFMDAPAILEDPFCGASGRFIKPFKRVLCREHESDEWKRILG